MTEERREGQTAQDPDGYGSTSIENGIRVFTANENDTPTGHYWVNVDERITRIRAAGYKARIEYQGIGSVDALLEGIGSQVWLAETHPLTANTVTQTGDGSRVIGSRNSEVVIADSVTRASGNLYGGADLLRVGIGTSYAQYDGGPGNDTISLSGIPVNTDIIAVMNRNQVVLSNINRTEIGTFTNFEAFNHRRTNGSRDTETVADILSRYQDTEGFASGIIRIADDGSIDFIPQSRITPVVQR